MTLNERVINALKPLGVYTSVIENPTDSGAIDRFIVIIPIDDNLTLYADNTPQLQTETAELGLYCKGNYLDFRNDVTKALISVGITITNRRYLEYEENTNYHHYIIDVAAASEEEF